MGNGGIFVKGMDFVELLGLKEGPPSVEGLVKCRGKEGLENHNVFSRVLEELHMARFAHLPLHSAPFILIYKDLLETRNILPLPRVCSQSVFLKLIHPPAEPRAGWCYSGPCGNKNRFA